MKHKQKITAKMVPMENFNPFSSVVPPFVSVYFKNDFYTPGHVMDTVEDSDE